MLSSDAEPDLVVVPVGGGGCIAGITTYLAERTANTAVLGIEPAGAAAMMAALAAGEPVTLDHVDQFVDGAAVNRAGALTYAALAAAGDMVSITTVDEGAVCTAMLDLYQNEGIIAEPAGALSVAGLLEADVEPGSTVVCLISGGNNDVSRYGEVLERSLIHLGLKHYFLVDFPQEPGALRRFLDDVLGPNDDITLFEYVKRNNRETGEALVGIELGSAAELDGLLARMRATEIARRNPAAGFAGLSLPAALAAPRASANVRVLGVSAYIRARSASDVGRQRGSGVEVSGRLRGSGRQVQRDHPGPVRQCEVFRVVGDAAVAHLGRDFDGGRWRAPPWRRARARSGPCSRRHARAGRGRAARRTPADFSAGSSTKRALPTTTTDR